MIASAVKSILWEVAKSRQQKSDEGSSSRDRESHFRLPCAAPLHCPMVLPLRCSLMLTRCSPLLPRCSLSRPGTAILDPKFGVYIIYIYTHTRGRPLEISKFDTQILPPLYCSILRPSLKLGFLEVIINYHTFHFLFWGGGGFLGREMGCQPEEFTEAAMFFF